MIRLAEQRIQDEARRRADAMRSKMDLVPTPETDGYNVFNAFVLANFANVAYFNGADIAQATRAVVELAEGGAREREAVELTRTLAQILMDDNGMEYKLYSTRPVLSKETIMCVGGKGTYDTQWMWASTDKVYVLGFRGTEGTSLRDAFSDLYARKVEERRCMRADKAAAGEPCKFKVHAGFRNSLDEVWPDVEREVQAAAAAGKSIFVTGHSLGGALATLATARLVLGLRVRVHSLYTFGAPRVFNSALAEMFDLKFGDRHFRFVNNNDLVPCVPLRIMGFEHAGTLMYIGSDGALARDPPPGDMWWDGIRGRVAAGFTADLILDPLTDHFMTGYVKCIAADHLERLAAASRPPPTPGMNPYFAAMEKGAREFDCMRDVRDRKYSQVIGTALSEAREACRLRHRSAADAAAAVAPGTAPPPATREMLARAAGEPPEEHTWLPLASAVWADGDTEPVFDVSAAMSRDHVLLMLVRAGEAGEAAEHADVLGLRPPVNEHLAHTVMYSLDSSSSVDVIPIANITGLRVQEKSRSRALVTVGASRSAVFYLLLGALFVVLAFGATVVHAHANGKNGIECPAGASHGDEAPVVTQVALFGWWKTALLLLVSVYAVHFAVPQFSSHFRVAKPTISQEFGVCVTLGYACPILNKHRVLTLKVKDGAVEFARVLEFVQTVLRGTKTYKGKTPAAVHVLPSPSSPSP